MRGVECLTGTSLDLRLVMRSDREFAEAFQLGKIQVYSQVGVKTGRWFDLRSADVRHLHK